MLTRVANRRTRLWALALALITNLGGGPMAWAHLGAGAQHESAASPMPADCTQHVQPDHSQPVQPMPCCDSGNCECAAPPAPPVMSLHSPADSRHDTLLAPPVARLLAPDPLDDPLRPPIR
jgi:hypothetical protein